MPNTDLPRADLHQLGIHVTELLEHLADAMAAWERCDNLAPKAWNDHYIPTCQLPAGHIGVDHWANTPIGPCVWSAGHVDIQPIEPLYDGGTIGTEGGR